MRSFLAELEAGQIPRTETTAQIAAEFTRELAGKRGRGRPSKPTDDRDSVGALIQSKLNKKGAFAADKRSVMDLLDFLSWRLAEGATESDAIREAATEFGLTSSGVSKRVKREGLMPHIKTVAEIRKRFFASPAGRAWKSLAIEIRQRATELGLPPEQEVTFHPVEEEDDLPISIEMVRKRAFAELERIAQSQEKRSQQR